MPQTEYKTPEQKKKFYHSSAWQELRQLALERDNYECEWCKREGKVTVDSVKEEGKRKEIVLNVDHKYSIEQYHQLALVLDNLETLCVYHHNVKKGRIFKRKKPKWDDERW
ncbi:5-methylcytosine-specific restriction endonuclease McrA [Bacillus thermophilus]|uniref:5-methylcytosine-specific restriction endonuclease McrA n=1 Tax=Siminovitchia thermophila TaxID=1245522 RepID=A0ABS2RD34_9BACI|nr:alpha/beta hydrolase [Siminovitchia thermophila]MBM7717290.1 5-methylcytosine-specific restriction endonuclease McrA [Siminovitchia thermophila]ONK24298.1 alpha/beta hydrolase [Bacillus sp. VT-16-64]